MPPVHVGKPSDQWLMTSQMHGRHVLEIPRPVRVSAMVIVKTLGRYMLVKSTDIYTYFFCRFRPTDLSG